MKMHRRQFLYAAAGGLSAAAFLNLRRDLECRSRTSWALGSETSITVWHHDSGRAEDGLAAAFEAIDRVEDIMSLYRPGSELCQLNASGFLERPHPYLVQILQYARNLSHLSAGAFDVTVQPLWAARQGSGSVEAPVMVDWRQLEVSSQGIRFKEPKMEATLNGIAQGFAADRVAGTLAEFGIRHALVDTGEIASLGQRQGEEPWRVGVQHPRDPGAYLCLTGLSDRCLATSGDYATALDAGFSEHHLIDPRTGRSPGELSSVSVAAASAMEADALSTAAFVLGLEKGMALIAGIPGADALMVRKSDGRVFASEGFPRIQPA